MRDRQSVHENRIYSVKMHCGDNYPDEPPTIQFISQVNLPAVNPRNGIVDPKMLPCLAQWKRDNTMETVLIELRRYVLLFFLFFSFFFRPLFFSQIPSLWYFCCFEEYPVADVGCKNIGTWLPRRTRRSLSLQRARPTHETSIS